MADEPAVDFGTFLRQAREKRGISLQQVSATTKISARVLEALERNDPRKLPGGIFSRAFVRSYAREVGLDPENAVEKFVAAFPELGTTESTPTVAVPDDPETFESRRRVATTVLQLIVISVVILIIVVVYYSMRRNQPHAVSVVPETTQEQRTVAQASAPPPVTPPAADQAPPGATPGDSPLSAPGPSSSTVATTTPGAAATPGGAPAGPAPTTQAPAATPAPSSPAPAASQAAETDAPLTIEIAATGACWTVLTIDGTRVMARTLDPGEHVSYPVRTFVTVNAGNAGALSLTLNGKAARSIGTAGQVVTATITPATFRTFLQQP